MNQKIMLLVALFAASLRSSKVSAEIIATDEATIEAQNVQLAAQSAQLADRAAQIAQLHADLDLRD